MVVWLQPDVACLRGAARRRLALSEGAVERDLDGVRLDAEQLADLPRRQVGAVAEREQLAVALVEAGHGLREVEPADRVRLDIIRRRRLARLRELEPGLYVSLRFGERCREIGIHRSMGSKGDCFDNAVAESFFATLEKDLLRRNSFPTRQEARTAVFEYIEIFHNRRRRHSSLGMLTPIEFELKNFNTTTQAA